MNSELSVNEAESFNEASRFKVQGSFICHIINYTGYNQK